jgi:hypothetical protein
MATMRTIGSGSKDTTPIATRRAGLVKEVVTCGTRDSTTSQKHSLSAHGIFQLSTFRHSLCKALGVQWETMARSNSVGTVSTNEQNDKTSYETWASHDACAWRSSPGANQSGEDVRGLPRMRLSLISEAEAEDLMPDRWPCKSGEIHVDFLPIDAKPAGGAVRVTSREANHRWPRGECLRLERQGTRKNIRA